MILLIVFLVCSTFFQYNIGQNAKKNFNLDVYKRGVRSFKILHTTHHSYNVRLLLNRTISYTLQYCKFIRVTCSTSNQTITKWNCKLKLIHRYLTFMNMELFLPKQMRSFLFAFNVSHRPLLGGKFRYIFGFKEINGCEVTKIIAGNPMLKPLIDFANSTVLRGIIRQCPYGPGFVRVENASVDLNTVLNFASKQSLMPNGHYKIDIKMYNKKDDNVLTLSVILESSWRLSRLSGDERF